MRHINETLKTPRDRDTDRHQHTFKEVCLQRQGCRSSEGQRDRKMYVQAHT